MVKPVSRFPCPLQKRRVPQDSERKVYNYEVEEDQVAFIYLVGAKLPENAKVEWMVDGEQVDLEREHIQVGSIKNPSRINPPIVVEDNVAFRVYSPVDYGCEVLLDGEVYQVEVPPAERVEDKEGLEEAVEAALQDVAPAKRSTYVDQWKNVSVDGTWEMCDLKGAGRLQECLVVTGSTAFNLIVEVDGRREYTGDYSQFSEYSAEIDEVVALEKDGAYRVHLSDLQFKQGLRVTVRGKLTLTKVYLKYSLETG